MSERKVLNKYYPPDYDPSKIPRVKEKRNSTFIIRVMAPCNMRCTTCGEYIYKGRKFNSRKEDVNDMNHLGLRIYRFYIKCTACMAEISFRTDPATTDYVLEAGATRNFEALAKAERQAEEEQRAHEEELKSNPMKLLEERTEQSKNEMDRMEALEELQEQNKREVNVDYENMLKKYDKQRELERKRQEDADEAYVKQLFGEHGEGSKIKRILDDDGPDSDEEEAARRKRPKKEASGAATDLLVADNKAKKEKEAWEKSVGSLGAGKKMAGLGIVVKKKKPVEEKKVEVAAPGPNGTPQATPSTSTAAKKAPAAGLSLIADYSDSSESE